MDTKDLFLKASEDERKRIEKLFQDYTKEIAIQKLVERVRELENQITSLSKG